MACRALGATETGWHRVSMNYLHFHLLMVLPDVSHPPFLSNLESALQESAPSAFPFLPISHHVWHFQLDFDLPREPSLNITSSFSHP